MVIEVGCSRDFCPACLTFFLLLSPGAWEGTASFATNRLDWFGWQPVVVMGVQFGYLDWAQLGISFCQTFAA
jgi:hypothetical protein